MTDPQAIRREVRDKLSVASHCGDNLSGRIVLQQCEDFLTDLFLAQAAQVEQLKNENARMSEWCVQAGAAMTAHSIEETNQRIRAEAAEAQLVAITAAERTEQ